jgi:cytochrome P450
MIPPDEHTVEFEKAPPDSLLRRVLHVLYSLPLRIYNTYLLIRCREFKKPASKNVCPMRYLNPFPYLHCVTRIAAKPAVMKAILKHPRKDPEAGFFDDQDNAIVFLPLLRDLFPGEKVTEEDFIFSCSKENLRKYRQPLLRFIGPQSIERQSGELQAVVDATLQFYCQGNSELTINATEFSFVLAVTTMSRLLLGNPGPFSVYRKIAQAIDQVNQYLMKKVLKQPFSKEQTAIYQQSLETIRTAIAKSLEAKRSLSNGSFIEALEEEKQLTPLQIKISLFVVYFAGSDTTAGLLNYILWQLGKHPELQEEIFEEISSDPSQSPCIQRVIAECLRLFTPAYVIGRVAARPFTCTVRDKTGKILFTEKIGKNEKLLNTPIFAGRDPTLFENPDAFCPQRFDGKEKSYSWLPFGDGAHSCPGQWLAKAEIALLLTTLIRKYRFTSSPDEEFEQHGYISLKPSEQVTLHLVCRDRLA